MINHPDNQKDCCSLPLYDSPKVCEDCHDTNGVTVIQGNKGTGMSIFSAWMAYKLEQCFGRGRSFPRYLDGVALDFLRSEAKNGNFLRASGDCLCPICHRKYGQHPEDPDAPTFVLLCDGSVMKL